MSYKVNVQTAEVSLTTANAFGTARVVRIVNDTVSNILVTKKNSGGTTLGSVTLRANSELIMEKAATDTLEAGSAVKASVVGYGFD